MMPRKKRIETLDDLIEDAKTRAVVWIILVLMLAKILSLTSMFIWINIPVAFLVIATLRYVFLEFEIRRRDHSTHRQSYLSHLQQRQLSPHDSLLLSPLDTIRWKRTIDSPAIAAAADEFIRKIIQVFVTDLWYSCITPDKEFPELLCVVINDVIGEVSQRIRRINLIDLLTRDIVDLVGSHLELFRKTQGLIGANVMATLSSEERDERLKHYLSAQRELHPALLSTDGEYKVLKMLMGGVVAVVLRPQEVQSPVVRSLARELLTCIVMQPIMDFASPGFINEIIEYVVLSSKDDTQNKSSDKENGDKSSRGNSSQTALRVSSVSGSSEQDTSDIRVFRKDKIPEGVHYGVRAPSISHETSSSVYTAPASPLHSRPADWAQALNAVRQKRTEVLAPENLDNLWTKGRNYRKKDSRIAKKQYPLPPIKYKGSSLKDVEIIQTHESAFQRKMEESMLTEFLDPSKGKSKNNELVISSQNKIRHESLSESPGQVNRKESALLAKSMPDMKENTKVNENTRNFDTIKHKGVHKRTTSDSTMPERWQNLDGFISSDFKKPSPTGKVNSDELQVSSKFDISAKELSQKRASHFSRLKCWVIGAHLEKVGTRTFAVYSIAVTDSENNTWFVDRRYSNFEQLHRRLRDIPNYSLHLPPKRFLSSSLDDYFVQQRCTLLDKYLKDLLSIPNIAEQLEVWDFLSATSKNYSYGKAPSVMKSLAVNVDDAMDDIVRQLKGVSGGLLRKVSGATSSEGTASETTNQSLKLPWALDSVAVSSSNYDSFERSQSLSEEEEMVRENFIINDGSDSGDSHYEPSQLLMGFTQDHRCDTDKNIQIQRQIERLTSVGASTVDTPTASGTLEDEVAVPPEWSPQKLSVPLLNLVDKVFQLKKRGWLRRQVLWISKQILQLVMEDAIDDWLLRQIEWLRKDDVIALAIRWIQDVILHDAIPVSNLDANEQSESSSSWSPGRVTSAYESFYNKFPVPPSFEQQREAARRARFVYETLLEGAPSTLVSLIGGKQYRRCAKDIYYFLQSRVFVKQLAYSLLELLLVTTFPELQELVVNIHRESQGFQT